MADNDLLETVDSLLDSLDDVEEALEPLLLKSLQETLASADGPIERAKVLFWLAYTIHSCTWAFTKTAGVDAEEHGVLEELNRIKRYNGKITAATKRAEATTSDATSPAAVPGESEKRRMPLDKDAASRFIRAGIANQPSKPSSSSTFYSAEATVSDPLAGPGPHSRLSSLARASTSQPTSGTEAAGGSSSDSEEDLQVYTSMVASTSATPAEPTSAETSAHQAISTLDESNKDGNTQADEDKKKKRQEKKRKRLLGVPGEAAPAPKVLQDPLSGYDNNATESKKAKKPKQSKSAAESQSQDVNRASSVAGGQTDSSTGPAVGDGDKKKKKRKKNKQEA